MQTPRSSVADRTVSCSPHTVFLRLPGGGEQLTVRSATEDLGVCIDSGIVGFPEMR